MLESCKLMTAGACGTNLPAQTDIVLGAAPYSITATELNPVGYSFSICLSCDIKPTGLPLITFIKDSIKIIGQPLDCSNSLTDAIFPNPAPIIFNSAGTSATIIEGYTEIFVHT